MSDDYLALPDAGEFPQRVGERVSVVGSLSQTPWQHMVDDPDGYPHANYFDLADGDQLVVYTKTPFEPAGKVRVRGVVHLVEGRSKRPGRQAEVFREWHILVDDWEGEE